MATYVDKTAYISINFIKIKVKLWGFDYEVLSWERIFFQIGANTTVLKGGFLSSWLTGLKFWVEGPRLSTYEASKRQSQEVLG